jgi:hypothetical protein
MKTEKYSRLAGIGLPVVRTYMNENGFKYVPYSGNGVYSGKQNTYPSTLSDLVANTPTHGGAILRKQQLTFGEGVNYDILPTDILNFCLNINDNMETINDIIKKISYDLVTFGGISLKVHWKHDKTINSIEHVPFKNVRLGYPVNGKIVDYVISNNWDITLPHDLKYVYKINKYNPDLIKESKIEDGELVVDDVTKENAEQLLYYKQYHVSQNDFYPLPDYVGCLDACFTELNTGIAMNAQISNGINGAYIVSPEDDTIIDDDTRQNVVNSLSDMVAGAENAGNITFVPQSIKVEKLEAIPFEIYKSVNLETRQRIITAHNIPAILLEFNFGGGFNNRSAELMTALDQFQQTVIKGYQNQITRILNMLLMNVSNEDFNIEILPFELIYSDGVKDILKITKPEQVKDTTGIE